MEVQYLNTDLEIESKDDLARIVEAFADDVVLMHHGDIGEYQHASFEVKGERESADEAINCFCSLVENLPQEVREMWDGCRSRILNVGFESGTTPPYYASEIKASTIRRVAEVGGSVVITIYPIGEEELLGNSESQVQSGKGTP